MKLRIAINLFVFMTAFQGCIALRDDWAYKNTQKYWQDASTECPDWLNDTISFIISKKNNIKHIILIEDEQSTFIDIANPGMMRVFKN